MNNSHQDPIKRLDQLLSQNQTIYKNLKSKLNDITKSNEKISTNIQFIKPFSENIYGEGLAKGKNNEGVISIQTELDSSKIESQCRLMEEKRRENNYEQCRNIYNKQNEEILSPKFHTGRQIEEKFKYSYQKFKGQKEPDGGAIEQNEMEKGYENRDSWSPQKTKINEQNDKGINECSESFSCIFVPFNKLYRSPIVQMTNHTTLLMSRRSKTQNIVGIQTNIKIVDGVKLRFKNILTDEEVLLERVYERGAANEIVVVGGENCLKKKIHMSLLSCASQDIASLVQQKEIGVDLCVSIDHQQILSGEQHPTITTATFPFKDNRKENKITFMQLEAFTKDIFQKMKKSSKNSNNKESYHLRLTKLMIQSINLPNYVCLTVVSTNKYNPSFISSLNLQKVVWCINPLYKYHQQTKETLQAAKEFITRKQSRGKKIFFN